MSECLVADGHSVQDGREVVRIDRDDDRDRWRYRCPNNHTYWQPTNGGIWCQACSRQGLDPHYHELYDEKTEESVGGENVRLR